MSYVQRNQVVFQQHPHPPQGYPMVLQPRNVVPFAQTSHSPYKPQPITPSMNVSSPHVSGKPIKVENPPKETFKEISSNFVKLRKQFNEIVSDADQKRKNYEERKTNKSTDYLYAPYQRLPEPNPPINNRSQVPMISQTQMEKNTEDGSRVRNRERSHTPTYQSSKVSSNQQNVIPNRNQPYLQKTQPSHIHHQNSDKQKRSPNLENTQKNEKNTGKTETVNSFDPDEERSFFRNTNDTFVNELNSSRTAQLKNQQKIYQLLEKEKRKSHQKELEFQKMKLNLMQKLQKTEFYNKKLLLEKEFLEKELKDKAQRMNELLNRNKDFSKKKEQLQQKEQIWKDKIGSLQKQVIRLKSSSRKSFDYVLKDQLDQISTFKTQMESKNEKIAHLQEVISLNRRKTEEAINDAKIEKIKYLTELKEKQQRYDIEILNKENESQTLKHALETMESKLKAAISDNRAKDEFLQQHLTGRLKFGEEQEYVKSLLKKYEMKFPVNNLAEKLLEQQKQIKILRQKLAQKQ